MKPNLIEVVEYDRLSVHSGQNGLDQATFDHLEQLILMQDEQDNAMDFLSLSVQRGVGKVIKAKNYVGVLQLSEQLQLQILPKIHGLSKAESKTVLLRMLKTLIDFPSKSFNEANLDTERMPLFELFIQLYVHEVQALVRKGLQSTYYTVEDNVKVYKGKMNFTQQIRHNSIHKERFYVAYDEYGLNRAENRLIKTTLLYLQKVSSSDQNIRTLKQVLLHFDAVDTSASIEQDFARIQLDRKIVHYENAIKWARVFLQHRSFTSFSGDVSMRSLLFPMERLFESYVGRTMKRLLQQSDWHVSLQDRTHYLFERQFALRPDIVLRHGSSQRTIVIDTKWKILENKPNRNYGISQADMYQMYAYGKKYGSNEIVMMYPLHDGFSAEATLQFTSDDGVNVTILFVQCEAIEESLATFFKQYAI